MERCPKCGSQIDPLWKFCTLCFYKLEKDDEVTPSFSKDAQKIEDSIAEAKGNVVQQTNCHEPQDTYYPRREDQQRKRRSPSPIAYLGLLIVIVIIVAGVAFTANSGPDPAPDSIPAVTSRFTQQVVLPVTINTPAPNEDESNSSAITECTQQYTNEQPPCSRQSGEPIHLVNNPNAKDVSFAELKSFILLDDTDAKEYLEGVRVCGDFAEMLHNNAESRGIKAAWVGIQFENEDIGHALNAFQTTDKGMIYVDCTGIKRGDTSSCQIDSIAYVEIGNRYGLIAINNAESPTYDYYVTYVDKVRQYLRKISTYQSKVQSFNSSYGGRTLSEEEYRQAEFKAADLIAEGLRLEALGKELDGCCNVNSVDIVKTVSVYW